MAWFALGSSEESAAVSEVREGEQQQRASLVHHARLSAASSQGRLCSFEPGTAMAYEVVSQTSVEIDMSRLADEVDAGGQAQVHATQDQAQQIDRSWHVELVAVARDDDGSSVLAARIDDGGITASNGAPTASAGLSDTFLIRVDPRCGIREFGWRSEGDLDAAREQQLMAAGLGFIAPSKTSEAGSYGGTSFDATGRYAARFNYEDGRINGAAVSYAIGSETGRVAPIAVEILASTIEVELAADAWFETLTNERDLEFSLGDRPFGTHFRSTQARRVAPNGFSPQVNLADGGWSFGRLGSKPRDPSTDFDEALREVPLDDALANYRELVASGSVSDYGNMLRDWLRANPEQTGELLARLRSGEFDQERIARSGLFYALGSANTEQAKGALVDILGAWPDVSHQIAAAHALSMVQQPTPEMIELVAAAANNEGLASIERGSMALALGTVANTAAAQDPELAAQARGQIHDWLAAPADEAQLGHALAAAGNAGHDELADVIGTYVDHESPTVRKQAAHAMRQMSPEQAYPHLEQALGDEDRVVRTSALETATSVARRHDQQPSEGLISLAADSLASAAQAEQRAAVALLGEAAKHGDAQADSLLREHLHAQLTSDDRNPERLAALGRSMSGHWKAAN
ncbi:hypothetical protein DB30_03829 [Enhygromyxa salina]|uniref:HEAT repeat protein n=1 Tax=Enhygromyxa salina TaxID=215803 RepID=A0A0C2A769_9BACT|nr:hypothetical protein DB30_03829 [Enhygromyxa salina]